MSKTTDKSSPEVRERALLSFRNLRTKWRFASVNALVYKHFNNKN